MDTWKLLLAFLCLAADEGGEGGENVEVEEVVDEIVRQDNFDEGYDLEEIIDENPPAKRAEGDEGGRANDSVRKARERAQESERARIRLEAENRVLREMSRNGAERSVVQDEESRIKAQEDADLERAKASGDQNYYENMKWRVDSMRHNRQIERNASQALFRASDLTDKSSFERLGDSKDSFVRATFGRFSKRVEEIREMQMQRGQSPTDRMIIFDHLVGKALREGDIKRKTAKSTSSTASSEKTGRTAPRGASPAVRSDVAGRQRNTESEKRRARLRNIQL